MHEEKKVERWFHRSEDHTPPPSVGSPELITAPLHYFPGMWFTTIPWPVTNWISEEHERYEIWELHPKPSRPQSCKHI